MALSRSLANPLDDFFSPFFNTQLMLPTFPTETALATRSGARHMAVDVKELDNAWEVKADLPGVNKEDIDVSVDGDVLRINVHHKEQKEEEKDEGGVKWHRVERSSMFSGRALRMPDTADLGSIKASYTDGVLKLDVPKHKKEEPKKITIA